MPARVILAAVISNTSPAVANPLEGDAATPKCILDGATSPDRCGAEWVYWTSPP